MIWRKGCPDHPDLDTSQLQYHPIRGYICPICGTRPEYLEASTVTAP